MLDSEPGNPEAGQPDPENNPPNPQTENPAEKPPTGRRRSASRPAGPPVEGDADASEGGTEVTVPAKKAAKRAPAKRTPRKTTKKAAAASEAKSSDAEVETPIGSAEVDGSPQSDVVVEVPPTTTPATETSAGDPADQSAGAPTPDPTFDAPAEPEAKRPARKRATRKAAAPKAAAAGAPEPETEVAESPAGPSVTQPFATGSDSPAEPDETPERPAPLARDPFAVPEPPAPAEPASEEPPAAESTEAEPPAAESTAAETAEADDDESDEDSDDSDEDSSEDSSDDSNDDTTEDEGDGNRRRRRRRGGRRRRRGSGSGDSADHGDDAQKHNKSEEIAKADQGADAEGSDAKDPNAQDPDAKDADDRGSGAKDADDQNDSDQGDESDGQRRRRRRRRRRGEDAGNSDDDPSDVVVRVREPRSRGRNSSSEKVTGIEGSTRMEAKRQRRREGREAGRRRAPILSEAEFLARRESVARTMVIRQLAEQGAEGALAQIAVLEDDILVEHYVDRESATSLIGNVYLGRVQNVLPSMEAAFIDIGRGRNAVLYAGEVDWESFGASGGERKVERVLKSGQTILVQVSKDPVGAKGARLTNHVSIPGRYLVYAPGGHLSGISRKLPENERQRLKDILAGPVGDTASVIVRTAAEGASEDELVRDINRLKAQWESIETKIKSGSAPQLLYAEPDLTIRIVRDLFTEDFSELIIQGNGSMTDAFDSVEAYAAHVAPHLKDRIRRWDVEADGDLFGHYRLDEQIAKGLERKVFLPSGGSLVIDRTEAMTVIDVNTGKFTGSGGNLEATITSNNLEAAEEIVRQLRLRDIGGIIVVDFIDMVLPANRELLLRRLVECLGRDRTRHQVAEVTSLGLVQMTRKKIGTGLLEAFTSECPHCHGRGVELHEMPVESQKQADGGARGDHRNDRKDNRSDSGKENRSDGGNSEQNSRGSNRRSGRGRSGGQTDESSSPKQEAQKSSDRTNEQPPVDDSVERAVEQVLGSAGGPVVAQVNESSAPATEPDGSAADNALSESPKNESAPSGGSRNRRGRRSAGRPAGPPKSMEAGSMEAGSVDAGSSSS